MLKRAAGGLLVVVVVSSNAWAVGSDKVKFMGGTVAGVPEKTEGRVDITDPESMVFTAEKTGAKVAVPWKTVTNVEYGQRVSRRWKTALFLTPWAVFSKGRKHMITVTYKDAAGADQAAVFEFGKDVFRNGLAALKAKSGVEVACQDEDAKKHYGGSCSVVAPEPDEKDKK